MSDFLFAALIGLVAGTIDVVPMILKKLNKTACWSAFVHYFVLGFIIPFVHWEIASWLKGILISLMVAIPVMIIVYQNDKKAIVPMLIFSIVLGAGIGAVGALLIG